MIIISSVRSFNSISVNERKLKLGFLKLVLFYIIEYNKILNFYKIF